MINQPEEDILQASPAFQNKLIALRQQLSDKEIQIASYNKQIIALKYEVDQLTKQKEELEKVLIPALDERQSKLQEKNKELEDNINVLEANKSELLSTISKEREQILQDKNDIDLLRKQALDKTSELQIREEAIIKREKETEEKNNKLDEKLKALKEIIG